MRNFNKLVYGFGGDSNFVNALDTGFKSKYPDYGLLGIPLAPDIIFLVSDDEKNQLKALLKGY